MLRKVSLLLVCVAGLAIGGLLACDNQPSTSPGLRTPTNPGVRSRVSRSADRRPSHPAATVQLTAIAHLADGSSRDITAECDLVSSNTDVLSVSAGRVTGVQTGEARVSVSFGGGSATQGSDRGPSGHVQDCRSRHGKRTAVQPGGWCHSGCDRRRRCRSHHEHRRRRTLQALWPRRRRRAANLEKRLSNPRAAVSGRRPRDLECAVEARERAARSIGSLHVDDRSGRRLSSRVARRVESSKLQGLGDADRQSAGRSTGRFDLRPGRERTGRQVSRTERKPTELLFFDERLTSRTDTSTTSSTTAMSSSS